MKKILTLFLAFILVTGTTVSCGKEEIKETPNEVQELKKDPFEEAKKAYNYICNANELTSEMSDDIYAAWRVGIYTKETYWMDLAQSIHLSNIDMGIGYSYVTGVAYDWKHGTDNDLFDCIEEGDKIIKRSEQPFAKCVNIIVTAYNMNGTVQKIEDDLASAKEIIKGLSSNNSDYEHYPAIKDFYTSTQAFFDLCKSPSGSLEQISSTFTAYQNEARNFESDLGFFFE